jgi:pimeloyl-ACP methyl ester carboxylesterase
VVVGPGGRAIGVRWFGAPADADGPVVLWCHGGLSCAADGIVLDGPARQRGLRVLAIDRPGIGASALHPGRTTGSFTDDVVAVLDGLDLGATAGAVGWSLGGQYALAAARIPTRVPAAAVVAGVPPLTWPGTRRSLSTLDRSLLSLAHGRVPEAVARAGFAAVGRANARAAARSGPRPSRMQVRTLGEVDAAVMAGPLGPAIEQAIADGTSSAAGSLEEYRAWWRPWGFEPAEVSVPVTVWRGDQDRLVGADAVRDLAAALPSASTQLVPGVGHLLLADGDLAGRVLDDLLA